MGDTPVPIIVQEDRSSDESAPVETQEPIVAESILSEDDRRLSLAPFFQTINIRTTAKKFRVDPAFSRVYEVIYVVVSTVAAFEPQVFASEASALTKGIYLEYDGIRYHEFIKKNSDFARISYMTTSTEIKGTTNQVLKCCYDVRRFLPNGFDLSVPHKLYLVTQDDLSSIGVELTATFTGARPHIAQPRAQKVPKKE